MRANPVFLEVGALGVKLFDGEILRLFSSVRTGSRREYVNVEIRGTLR